MTKEKLSKSKMKNQKYRIFRHKLNNRGKE